MPWHVRLGFALLGLLPVAASCGRIGYDLWCPPEMCAPGCERDEQCGPGLTCAEGECALVCRVDPDCLPLPSQYPACFLPRCEAGACRYEVDPAFASDGSTCTPIQFHLAPNGSDTGDGSAGQPWQSWTYALSQLDPGETLIVEDGTWTNAGTCDSGWPTPCQTSVELPDIDCSQGISNGAPGAPITVRARNERQALLMGDGGNAWLMENCEHWTLEGLRMQGRDHASRGGHTVILNGANLVARRLLVSESNRCGNYALVWVTEATDVLLEENEAYSFHRFAFFVGSASTRATLRRNYANSLAYTDSGCSGYSSAVSDQGDYGVRLAEASSVLLENNIMEDAVTGFHSGTAGREPVSDDDRYFGNVASHVRFGFSASSDCRSENPCPVEHRSERHTYVDNLALNVEHNGFGLRSVVAVTLRNNTVFGAAGRTGYLFETGSGNATLASEVSVAGENLLAVGFTTGIDTRDYDTGQWLFDSANVFDATTAYEPADVTCPNCYQNNSVLDPALGTCLVFVPSTSPLSGAGLDGADVGARILQRYEDGVLSSEGLWDATTGGFPCGAQIPGVNDEASGSVCANVHERLNVRANGCSVP